LAQRMYLGLKNRETPIILNIKGVHSPCTNLSLTSCTSAELGSFSVRKANIVHLFTTAKQIFLHL